MNTNNLEDTIGVQPVELTPTPQFVPGTRQSRLQRHRERKNIGATNRPRDRKVTQPVASSSIQHVEKLLEKQAVLVTQLMESFPDIEDTTKTPCLKEKEEKKNVTHLDKPLIEIFNQPPKEINYKAIRKTNIMKMERYKNGAVYNSFLFRAKNARLVDLSKVMSTLYNRAVYIEKPTRSLATWTKSMARKGEPPILTMPEIDDPKNPDMVAIKKFRTKYASEGLRNLTPDDANSFIMNLRMDHVDFISTYFQLMDEINNPKMLKVVKQATFSEFKKIFCKGFDRSFTNVTFEDSKIVIKTNKKFDQPKYISSAAAVASAMKFLNTTGIRKVNNGVPIEDLRPEDCLSGKAKLLNELKNRINRSNAQEKERRGSKQHFFFDQVKGKAHRMRKADRNNIEYEQGFGSYLQAKLFNMLRQKSALEMLDECKGIKDIISLFRELSINKTFINHEEKNIFSILLTQKIGNPDYALFFLQKLQEGEMTILEARGIVTILKQLNTDFEWDEIFQDYLERIRLASEEEENTPGWFQSKATAILDSIKSISKAAHTLISAIFEQIMKLWQNVINLCSTVYTKVKKLFIVFSHFLLKLVSKVFGFDTETILIPTDPETAELEENFEILTQGVLRRSSSSRSSLEDFDQHEIEKDDDNESVTSVPTNEAIWKNLYAPSDERAERDFKAASSSQPQEPLTFSNRPLEDPLADFVPEQPVVEQEQNAIKLEVPFVQTLSRTILSFVPGMTEKNLNIDEKEVTKWNNRLRLATSWISFMKQLVAVFVHILSYVFSWIARKLGLIDEPTYVSVSDIVSEICALDIKIINYKAATNKNDMDEELAKEVVVLYQKCSKMVDRIAHDRDNVPVYGLFGYWMKHLTDKHVKPALAILSENPSRETPMWINLCGAPAAGKTILTPFIARKILRKNKIKKEIYTWDETAFQDGYLGEQVITYQDIFQAKDPAIDMQACMAIIRLISSDPYCALVASPEKKGRVFIRPRLVVTTTNAVAFAAPTALRDPNAFLRRRMVNVEVLRYPGIIVDHEMSAEAGLRSTLFVIKGIFKENEVINVFNARHFFEYIQFLDAHKKEVFGIFDVDEEEEYDEEKALNAPVEGTRRTDPDNPYWNTFDLTRETGPSPQSTITRTDAEMEKLFLKYHKEFPKYVPNLRAREVDIPELPDSIVPVSRVVAPVKECELHEITRMQKFFSALKSRKVWITSAVVLTGVAGVALTIIGIGKMNIKDKDNEQSKYIYDRKAPRQLPNKVVPYKIEGLERTQNDMAGLSTPWKSKAGSPKYNAVFTFEMKGEQLGFNAFVVNENFLLTNLHSFNAYMYFRNIGVVEKDELLLSNGVVNISEIDFTGKYVSTQGEDLVLIKYNDIPLKYRQGYKSLIDNFSKNPDDFKCVPENSKIIKLRHWSDPREHSDWVTLENDKVVSVTVLNPDGKETTFAGRIQGNLKSRDGYCGSMLFSSRSGKIIGMHASGTHTTASYVPINRDLIHSMIVALDSGKTGLIDVEQGDIPFSKQLGSTSSKTERAQNLFGADEPLSHRDLPQEEIFHLPIIFVPVPIFIQPPLSTRLLRHFRFFLPDLQSDVLLFLYSIVLALVVQPTLYHFLTTILCIEIPYESLSLKSETTMHEFLKHLFNNLLTFFLTYVQGALLLQPLLMSLLMVSRESYLQLICRRRVVWIGILLLTISLNLYLEKLNPDHSFLRLNCLLKLKLTKALNAFQ